jgi:selenocysteine lyase/cysteine desulfurase
MPSQKIHFNNAGSSLPPDIVVEAVVSYLREEAAVGGYETEAKYKEQLENVYTSIARLINAKKDEIALVENASAAWSLAFKGLSFQKGDVVITSEMEYVTNLLGLLEFQKTHGIEVRMVPNDEQGNFSLAALEAAIGPRTRLVAMTHIPSSAGNVLPVADIGRIAHKHQILYLLDACQSAGQVPIDVNEINCDFLAVTGRKYLRAPRGTGFLYVRKEVQDQLTPLMIDGFSTRETSLHGYELREDARRFELYEKSRALTLGLGKAVDYALAIGLDSIWRRIQQLAGLMRLKLSAIDGITVHDRGDQLCGIVTFSLDAVDSTLIKKELAAKNINVSIGAAHSTLYYMSRRNLDKILRASVHYYNTEEEIDIFCDALVAIREGVELSTPYLTKLI